MCIAVKAESVVQVKLEDVLRSWLGSFMEKLPLADSIEEISIDPETGRPVAVWNIGSDAEPKMKRGRIHISCKDVVMYDAIVNLLELASMPNGDKKFLDSIGFFGDSSMDDEAQQEEEDKSEG